MKSEKGLTFFSTVILVIIIALIAFLVVYFVKMQTNEEKIKDEKVDVLQVQAKVHNISAEYLRSKKIDELIGTKLSDMKEDGAIKEFLEKGLFNLDEKGKKYYVLNKQNLNDMGLEKIELEDNCYYIAEYTTGETYYTKGYTDENGQVCYKITELEETNNEDDNENKNESKNENKSESKDKTKNETKKEDKKDS